MLNVACLLHWRITIFQHNFQACWCIYPILASV